MHLFTDRVTNLRRNLLNIYSSFRFSNELDQRSLQSYSARKSCRRPLGSFHPTEHTTREMKHNNTQCTTHCYMRSSIAIWNLERNEIESVISENAVLYHDLTMILRCCLVGPSIVTLSLYSNFSWSYSTRVPAACTTTLHVYATRYRYLSCISRTPVRKKHWTCEERGNIRPRNFGNPLLAHILFSKTPSGKRTISVQWQLHVQMPVSVSICNAIKRLLGEECAKKQKPAFSLPASYRVRCHF